MTLGMGLFEFILFGTLFGGTQVKAIYIIIEGMDMNTVILVGCESK